MKQILGLDEVGRGPWAGPLVVGACILPRDENGELSEWTKQLTDSKKLSAKKRSLLSAEILAKSPATGLGWVSSRELDEIGLSAALRLATRRAVAEVRLTRVPFTEIIIDGTVNFLHGTSLEKYVSVLKKADFLIKEVSAASILAKVARDEYMQSLATVYPKYGFEKHVGYGTALHRSALNAFGPCPEHRFSFGPISALSGEEAKSVSREPNKTNKPTTTQLGNHAESIVADFLIEHGHKIIARNHKTPFYEIDIISVRDGRIYFTEVKYRKSQYRGSSLAQIDAKKVQQMTFAAESFLKFSPTLKQNFSPLLAAASVSGTDFTLDDWVVLN